MSVNVTYTAQEALEKLKKGNERYLSAEKNEGDISPALLEVSEKYVFYGLCDESVIVCEGDDIEFYGEIYKIEKGNVERV